MRPRPNVLFVLADQLRAASTPLYGAHDAPMPHLERLAREGVTFTNAVSTCPLCTPYRAMLLTGRHPQSTGHVVNFVATRPDEIGIGDAFSRAGYRTGWVGKWHLTAGRFPQTEGDESDVISEGRPRLGFEYFRGYNYHTRYYDGWLSADNGCVQRWSGYETEGLLPYCREFLDIDDQRPFCLFVSPHQPHLTSYRPFAPEACFARVPAQLDLPPNVAEQDRPRALEMQRNYLAMTIAVDDMLGRILEQLQQRGCAGETLVVFASDHGTMGGAHGVNPWCKKLPYEESIHVPLVARLPGVLPTDAASDTLIAPVDLFPTLAALCAVEAPHGVEGIDHSSAWCGQAETSRQDAVLTMNFTSHPDLPVAADDPRRRPHYEPWRGLRTKRHHLIRWLSGQTALFDLQTDPYQMRNLSGETAHAALERTLAGKLDALLANRGDCLEPELVYADWFDQRRRIVHNAFGPLPDPDCAFEPVTGSDAQGLPPGT